MEKVKNIIKKINNILKPKSKKKGAELTEVMVMTGIIFTIALTVFFPEIREIISKNLIYLKEWFSNAFVTLGYK